MNDEQALEGKWFISRMYAPRPAIYKAAALLAPGCMICERWGMIEDRWIWHFGKQDGGVQVAVSNLKDMEQVSGEQARWVAEMYLRDEDAKWRAQYGSHRAPVRIVPGEVSQ